MSALMTAGKLGAKHSQRGRQDVRLMAIRPPSPTGPAPWEKMTLPNGADLIGSSTERGQRCLDSDSDSGSGPALDRPRLESDEGSGCTAVASPVGTLQTLDELDILSEAKLPNDELSEKNEELRDPSSTDNNNIEKTNSGNSTAPTPTFASSSFSTSTSTLSISSISSTDYTTKPKRRMTNPNPYDAGATYIAPGQILDEHQGQRIRAREENMESLHSLLTRKAALLFLLFPLTVSISLSLYPIRTLADDQHVVYYSMQS